MHWNHKAPKNQQKYTSRTQELKELKRKMALWRKKKTENEVSAFDEIPEDVKGKLIEDIITIVRTLKAWPTIVPIELHKRIGEEVVTALRKSALSLAGAMMSNDSDMSEVIGAFKGITMPQFATQVIHAVKLALTTVPEFCKHGVATRFVCTECAKESNGTAP